jgi:hypothetical protein
MNINATLLVQVGNFFIAYFLFRIILLRRACQVIDQEDAYRESLNEQIMHGREQFDEKKALQRKQWLQLHQFYKKNQPTLLDHQVVFHEGGSFVSIEQLSMQEIETLAHQMSTTIVERVGGSK